jgi:hypothetical protein
MTEQNSPILAAVVSWIFAAKSGSESQRFRVLELVCRWLASLV